MDSRLLDPEVQTLFERVLALPEEERVVFLELQCANQPALRNTLEQLLAASLDSRDDFLPGGALDGALWSALDIEQDRADPFIDQRVGAYRLVERVGEGGMSRVYLAERDDGTFEHRVAIKILRSRARNTHGLERFNQERQALANLTHANIAQLVDGGVTADGAPFLVMEYVDGKPIDTYCSDHALSTREVLELMLAVARAVAHAHRNLILHRDIKPSNVLVTNDGVVKLVDFGIAKFLQDDTDEAAADLTQTGLRPMTPRYASPEQVAGAAMTTASDIYQLGCLLYLLLAGRSPHGSSQSNPAQMLDDILHRDPEPPSRVPGADRCAVIWIRYV